MRSSGGALLMVVALIAELLGIPATDVLHGPVTRWAGVIIAIAAISRLSTEPSYRDCQRRVGRFVPGLGRRG